VDKFKTQLDTVFPQATLLEQVHWTRPSWDATSHLSHSMILMAERMEWPSTANLHCQVNSCEKFVATVSTDLRQKEVKKNTARDIITCHESKYAKEKFKSSYHKHSDL